MPKATISVEMRNAIVWLEKQPGVTGVSQGRFTRSRHHHAAGFTRIMEQDNRQVRIRVFDQRGTKDVIAYAPRTPLRDRWVALLAGGEVITTNGKNGHGPAPVIAQEVQPIVIKPMTEPAKLAVVRRPNASLVEQDAAQLFDVTPDLAAEWLEHNTRNRKLYQRVVNRYAADMKAGRWMVTGDAIAFDRNGAIINGQHRLWAVLESGITVRMMVAFNLDPAAVAVLDDHLKRNLKDVATIRRPGSTIGSVHTAMANMLVQSSIRATAADVVSARDRVSRQVQLDALDKHMDAIEFVYRECFRSAKMRSVTVAPVMTPMARAYYSQDRDRLVQFGRALLSGVVDEPAKDVSAIKLRNLLLKATTQNIRSTAETIYRKTERALEAFLKGERIETLYEAADELFPLPEEKTVPAAKRRT